MNDIQEKIDSVMEKMPDNPRAHIGPSQAGEPCDRRLWLGFRWAVDKKFPGRMLRLFKRGQDEEARVVSILQAIGYDVREYGEDQRRVSFGGHVSGSVDGVIISPISAILEIKTHNLKSYNELEKSGVGVSKPEHYIQMQCYMKATDIHSALYIAVCKDDDRIYNEQVSYNAGDAERAIKRLRRISETEHIPEPISNDPTWYQCRFCECHEFCHASHITRNVNCRTCAHSTPMLSGEWHCMRWKSKVPTDAQREGCDAHTPHPDLVPWRLDRNKSTELSGFYEGVGLIGEGGMNSKDVLKQ